MWGFFSHYSRGGNNDINGHKSGVLVQMIYRMALKTPQWNEMKKTSMTKDSQGILLGKHIFQAIKCLFFYMTEMWMGPYRNSKQSIIADYPVN